MEGSFPCIIVIVICLFVYAMDDSSPTPYLTSMRATGKPCRALGNLWMCEANVYRIESAPLVSKYLSQSSDRSKEATIEPPHRTYVDKEAGVDDKTKKYEKPVCGGIRLHSGTTHGRSGLIETKECKHAPYSDGRRGVVWRSEGMV